MKAKLLKRIRKNWVIGIEKDNKLFPSRIAVGKGVYSGCYEYSWADSHDFLKLLLVLSGIGYFKREILYGNHLNQSLKRANKRLRDRGIERKLELLYKIDNESVSN